MAAGFRSLFAPWVGGASGVTPVSTGSVRSMLAPWIGGAASPSVVVHAGVRGLLAPWIGGASAPPIIVHAGVRDMLAFWMGGAVPGPEAPIPPKKKTIFGGHGRAQRRFLERLEREDEEIIYAVVALLGRLKL